MNKKMWKSNYSIFDFSKHFLQLSRNLFKATVVQSISSDGIMKSNFTVCLL